MDTRRKVESFIAEKTSEVSSGRVDKSLMPGTLPFVTITSESGAGGNRLAQSLLDLIDNDTIGHESLRGWRIFDKSMCQQVLDEEHLADSVNELLQEDYHSQIAEFVMGFFGDRGMQNVAYARLAQLLRTVAAVGKVIVLGHGGRMATRNLAGGTHVRLVAPLPVRAARMASLMEVTEAEATRQIQRRDDEKRKLLKTHYRIDSANPELYDMVCNTEHMSPETIAELILSLIHRQVGIHRSQ